VKVLVADDEALIRMTVRTVFEEMGAEVLEARNGAVALDVLKANPDIALLFTDVVMPVMDGIELARRAAELRPTLRIALTTAYSDTAQVDWRYAVIKKPWETAQLQALLLEAATPPR
jgi:CheY-like chemotaxis protein